MRVRLSTRPSIRSPFPYTHRAMTKFQGRRSTPSSLVTGGSVGLALRKKSNATLGHQKFFLAYRKHHMQGSRSELLVPHDDRLQRLWRCVVVRCKLQGQAIHVSQMEGFDDLLFIAASLIPAAHVLSVYSSACVSTIGTPFPHRKIFADVLRHGA
jgi:hypothetical protein